jgi:hypothetical protein
MTSGICSSGLPERSARTLRVTVYSAHVHQGKLMGIRKVRHCCCVWLHYHHAAVSGYIANVLSKKWSYKAYAIHLQLLVMLQRIACSTTLTAAMNSLA